MSTIGLAGCQQNETAVSQENHDIGNSEIVLSLPDLTPVDRDGGPLKVVATTSIIGDIVAQVGGDAIALTTLIPPGQDPHSYEPAAQELTAVADADVIFVNGWDLEETLVHNLESIGQDVPIVPVSANITPLSFGSNGNDDEQHRSNGVDPHIWFSIQNVRQWVKNIEASLSQRDPTHAEIYANNATAYQAELYTLETYANAELGSIPAEKRFLVTNHDSFAYLAEAYDFEVVGTVIPGSSTLAEPSARDLTALIATMNEHSICTIFTETTVSDTLAQTTAAELKTCETVRVIPLFTGSLGSAGSGADSYLNMFRHNIDAIANGLGN